MPIRKYTLHDLVREYTASAETVADIKAAAIEELKKKIVWDKRAKHLVENMPLNAYVMNTETKEFELDLEYLKEAAMLASLDFGNGKRFYIGF